MNDQALKNSVSQELMSIKVTLGTINAKIDKTAAEVRGELTRWIVAVGLLQMTLIVGLALQLTH